MARHQAVFIKRTFVLQTLAKMEENVKRDGVLLFATVKKGIVEKIVLKVSQFFRRRSYIAPLFSLQVGDI